MSKTDLMNEYSKIRQLTRDINDKLITALPKPAFQDSVTKLKLLKPNQNTLTDEQFCVMADFTIYYHFYNGSNVVNHFLNNDKIKKTPEELTILNAMKSVKFSMLAVKEIKPDGQILVKNLFTSEEFILIDKGLSESSGVGQGFVTNILSFEKFAITTGAPLAVNNLKIAESINTLLAKHKKELKGSATFEELPQSFRAQIISEIIQICLKNDVLEKTKYQDIER